MKKLIEKGYTEVQIDVGEQYSPSSEANGDIRVTTNLIALNRSVKLDRYLLLNIDEIVFSTLSLLLCDSTPTFLCLISKFLKSSNN
jgi:hypothetical protein